jgi:hypothetical protein
MSKAASTVLRPLTAALKGKTPAHAVRSSSASTSAACSFSSSSRLNGPYESNFVLPAGFDPALTPVHSTLVPMVVEQTVSDAAAEKNCMSVKLIMK